MGDRAIARKALSLLACGPGLAHFLDQGTLVMQARSVENDPHVTKGERSLTHPLIMRRILRFA